MNSNSNTGDENTAYRKIPQQADRFQRARGLMGTVTGMAAVPRSNARKAHEQRRNKCAAQYAEGNASEDTAAEPGQD